MYCGAKPVFADIDAKTYNILPGEIEKKITERTKAIIPVHFAGQSCDMEAIVNIVKTAEKKYGRKIYIIEDACHALGSLYKNSKLGSCTFSDMTTMSFHPVKHITTGEGGIVLTNDDTLYKKLQRYRSHGITNDPNELQSNPGMWYYEQIDLGYNYRITDIQCALGISQLSKLPSFLQRRREIVDKYNEAFQDIDNIRIPFESKDCDSNLHLYVLQIDFDRIGLQRNQFMLALRSKRIASQVHYIPVYSHPYYRNKFQYKSEEYLNNEEYYKKCLSIPLFPNMSNKDVEKVINAIIHLVRGNQ